MKRIYTTQLQAGLGLIDETKILFDLWDQKMSTKDLYQKALESGQFSNISARRLRNIVAECFAPRFLVNDARSAMQVKPLLSILSQHEIKQLFFLYTCRANNILRAFVDEVYWPSYAAGANNIGIEQARLFVLEGCQQSLTSIFWSESTIKRVGSYLMGACADFGLLSPNGRQKREINPFQMEMHIALFLVYDLRFQGLSDNAIVAHEDWKLFGLDEIDTREVLKRLSIQNHFVMQGAANVVHIGWKYKTWQEVVNVIA